VLDGVKAGALGEHPAGKDPLHLAREAHLVDLDEGCRMGLLGRRTGIAHPRRHLEGAELDRLVEGNLKMRDAPSDLVEGGEDRDRVLDDLGMERARCQAGGEHQGERCKGRSSG